MSYWEYVLDATLATMALFGLMAGGVVVLCAIGVLLSDGSDDDAL